jgi:7-cyano-7-deazaguanine synthase in queuosine biosynthesis
VKFRVRTRKGETIPVGDVVLLDWLPGSAARTIDFEPRFLAGLAPKPEAYELLRLACAVYCADRIALRRDAPDHWTRELELYLPVSDPGRWNEAAPHLVRALEFLSDDSWRLRFRRGDAIGQPRDRSEIACVSLFSGGLDSLAGAIDLLEAGARPILVGHYDRGLTPSVQVHLARALIERYGEDRGELRQLRARAADAHPTQARVLPGAGRDDMREKTTRARSLLFIAAGLAVASAGGPSVTLYVPENGFIGLNVPLTAARVGGLSTRTTHPFFMTTLGSALTKLGIENPIINPYRLNTKGEVLRNSRAPDFLRALAPASLSCAHPETARWAKRRQGNCGYCFPCLIRRAALNAAGADDGAAYAWDVLREGDAIGADFGRGADLRALRRSLETEPGPIDVFRNGLIPTGDAADFAAVHLRGRQELRAWIG